MRFRPNTLSPHSVRPVLRPCLEVGLDLSHSHSEAIGLMSVPMIIVVRTERHSHYNCCPEKWSLRHNNTRYHQITVHQMPSLLCRLLRYYFFPLLSVFLFHCFYRLIDLKIDLFFIISIGIKNTVIKWIAVCIQIIQIHYKYVFFI